MAAKNKSELHGKAETLTQQLDVIVGYSASMQIRSARQGSLKLSRQEGFTVNALGRAGRATMSALAQQLTCSMSALTLLIDRLTEMGVVTRERAVDDRRVVLVELTAKGMSLYQEHLKNHLSLSRGMLGALSPKDQDELIRILGAVVASLGRGGDEADA